MSESLDWDHVTVIRKRPTTTAAGKSAGAINAALRTGAAIDTSKKFAAGTNRQGSGAVKDTAKLDRETEELHHDRVPPTVGKAMAAARAAKNPPMTQKALATAINEKPQVVNEYEAGKAIPNPAVLSKLERALGVKLRGKNIGEPLGPKKPATAAKK